MWAEAIRDRSIRAIRTLATLSNRIFLRDHGLSRIALGHHGVPFPEEACAKVKRAVLQER